MRTKRRHILIIYLLAIIGIVYLLSATHGLIDGYDSKGYIDAVETLKSGTIDAVRTPVYPFIIGFAQAFGGAGWRWIIFTIQCIAALIALWYFYKLALRLIKSEPAAFLSACFMAIWPSVISCHIFLMTESLALSGSIFFVSCAVGIYDGKSRWNILGFAFWLLFLIFLRPSLVYFLPVSAVALFVMFGKRRDLRKRACVGLLAVIAVTASLFAYMLDFKKTYGVMTPTRVSLYNEYYMMRVDGSLNPSASPDKTLADFISRSYENNGTGLYDFKYEDIVANEADYVFAHWPLPVIYSTLQRSKTWKNQLHGIIRRFYYSGKDVVAVNSFVRPLNALNFTLGWIYLLVFVYGLWLFVHLIRTGRLPWLPFLLLMLGASNIIVAVVGAYGSATGEWGRLLYPSRFIFLLMLVQMAISAWQHGHEPHLNYI